ncbi:MAG TPA: hypothetical protein VEA18_03375 [Candidatus Kapabacteria bacterium]|nr:hypothetical protein [Candidatus Kapabacteria bacterium]
MEGKHHLRGVLSTIGAVMLGLMMLVGMDTPANAATEGKIEMVHSYTRPDGFTAVVKNTGGSTTGVLVDIEMYDSAGQKVYQRVYNKVYLRAGSSFEYQLGNPYYLKPGNYYYSVGIFGVDWNGLQRWYHSVQTYTKPEKNQQQPATAVLSVTTTIANGTVTAGQANALTATVHSANASSKVLIDLEVFNNAGQKVAQKFVDNVTINANGSYTVDMTTPTTLTPGQYRFSVGLFNPGWAGMIKWHNDGGTFQVQ